MHGSVLSAGPAELPNPQFLLVNCGPLSRAGPSPSVIPIHQVEAALKLVDGAASTFKRTLVIQLSTCDSTSSLLDGGSKIAGVLLILGDKSPRRL